MGHTLVMSRLEDKSRRYQIIFWLAWWFGSYSLARFGFEQDQLESLGGATIFTFLCWVFSDHEFGS